MSPRATTRRILRAIIYVRVSSFDTTAEEAANNSPDVQRARCLARITAEGWELADDIGEGGVIFDLDVSGSDKGARLNRPGLLLARNAIKARRADVIVSLRLDRLARNTIDLLTLAEELEQHGGAFALAEGDINTAGPYGKLILTIIAAIAEMEAKMITARTMAGKVAAREQGRWIGTRIVPFGFRKVPHPSIKDAWTLAHDPVTAPVVVEVARMVREGATAYRIAHWLNESGVPTVKGTAGGWRVATVRDVFTHEVMVGRSYWQGDVLLDENGLPRTVFPPLVDLDMWRVLCDKLGTPDRNRSKKAVAPRPEDAGAGTAGRGSATARFLLSGGTSRCVNCGGPLSAGSDHQGRKRYRCDRRGKGRCTRGVTARIDELDSLVTQRFLAFAGSLRVAEEVVTEERPDASRRADLGDALRVARAALADAVETEDDDAESAARAQVKALRAELDALPADTAVRRNRVWSSETYSERFARLDTAGRRELLAPLVTVTVRPATERTVSGRYDNSPEALERRVTITFADVLEDAAVGALDPFEWPQSAA